MTNQKIRGLSFLRTGKILVPLVKPLHAFVYTYVRTIAEIAAYTCRVGVCTMDIAGLHASHLLDSLPSCNPFDSRDEVEKLHRRRMADIIDAMRYCVVGRMGQNAHHTVYNVIDISEVTAEMTVVEHPYLLAFDDGFHKEEWSHIGPSPRTINREEP